MKKFFARVQAVHTCATRALSGLALALALTTTPGAAAALAQDDAPGAWLETSPPANWNAPGASVPTAPDARGQLNFRCGSDERSPESPEEEQVAAAGWRIFSAARVGWGLRTVTGLVEYDGMCRPLHYQGFVFADGQFIGTIAPDAMDSRVDGAGRVVDLFNDEVATNFVRYTPADPLCCPSSTFFVRFQVDRSGDSPVLVPVSAARNPL